MADTAHARGTGLPPGLTAAAWHAAQKSFQTVLGADGVFFEDADRLTYSDKFAIDDTSHRPLGGMAPASTEQVQALVRIAAEHRVPLWPMSRGKNFGYGAAAPRLAGSVVLDLSRMKKIEVDPENGTVLVEPGVGFYDLYDHLAAHDIKLWLSCPANSWGSVAGNALDRGVGYTPYGENTRNICGLEVVLANGEVVRTGMGAMAGSPMWQLYRYGYGPSWDQMFVQSNFGIVTRLGLWLMPEPEAVLGMDVEMDRAEDLGPLIDALSPLRREGVLQQNPTIGNWLRAATILTTRTQWTDKPGALDDSVIDAIRKKFGMGWWGVSLSLYGRESLTRASYAILEQAVKSINPLSIKPNEWHRGQPRPASIPLGVPSTFPLASAGWYGGRGGHVGFSPVLPQSGRLALEQFQRTYARYKEFGMDYQGSFAFGERHIINVNALLLNRDNPQMMGRVDGLLRALIADSRKYGYGEYRTHLDYMDAVGATYDFNDHALRRLNERVKDALDPHGIIAPGKSGIWPAPYRQERQS